MHDSLDQSNALGDSLSAQHDNDPEASALVQMTQAVRAFEAKLEEPSLAARDVGPNVMSDYENCTYIIDCATKHVMDKVTAKLTLLHDSCKARCVFGENKQTWTDMLGEDAEDWGNIYEVATQAIMRVAPSNLESAADELAKAIDMYMSMADKVACTQDNILVNDAQDVVIQMPCMRCESLTVALDKADAYDAEAKKKTAHGIKKMAGKHWEKVFCPLKGCARLMMKTVM